MKKIKLDWHFSETLKEAEREPLRLKLKPLVGAWVTKEYPGRLKQLRDNLAVNNSTLTEVFPAKGERRRSVAFLCVVCQSRFAHGCTSRRFHERERRPGYDEMLPRGAS
jgi:hypothetical protein